MNNDEREQAKQLDYIKLPHVLLQYAWGEYSFQPYWDKDIRSYQKVVAIGPVWYIDWLCRKLNSQRPQ